LQGKNLFLKGWRGPWRIQAEILLQECNFLSDVRKFRAASRFEKLNTFAAPVLMAALLNMNIIR
jgi:hypothetical protein